MSSGGGVGTRYPYQETGSASVPGGLPPLPEARGPRWPDDLLALG